MNDMADHLVCSICGKINTSVAFPVKDYSISQEGFHLQKCESCNYLYTIPAPDPSAIGKYYASDAYISHTDGKKGLIEQLYQVVRKFTLSGKRNLISSFVQQSSRTLLDYGCGTGAFLMEMKQHHWKVQGIEPDAGAREKAERLVGMSIHLPQAVHSFPSSSFDAITMWHVLEHVHDLNAMMGEVKRLVTPAGKIFIAVPNHTSFDAKHYGSYWAAYDVPRHLHHFSPTAMKKLVEKHGLHLVAIKAMWFDAYYVAMLSEKYRRGNPNYLKAFLIGIASNFQALFKREKCSSLIYIISK
jgi:2-polyprenyl-3-methyl-5-hydroxy-6-metoxy-1,4-benzoquinol methylase